MDFIEKFYHTDIDSRVIGDMKLCYCGKRTGAKDHSFGPAARDNYWLIFLKEGSGIYKVGDRIFALKPGDLFAAFPNRRIFYRADPGSVWSIGWVSIAAERFGDYLAMTGVTEDNPVVHIADPKALSELIDSLLCEVPAETLRSKFACSSMIYRLLELLSPENSPAVRRDYIDEAIFYMSNNYINRITTPELALRLGLETSYFSRLFKKRTGLPPMKWLCRLRLEKALDLLSTDLMISEIALSVGFSDPLYFTRRFTELYGISPTGMRAKKHHR